MKICYLRKWWFIRQLLMLSGYCLYCVLHVMIDTKNICFENYSEKANYLDASSRIEEKIELNIYYKPPKNFDLFTL